jgi:hypothetical protein
MKRLAIAAVAAVAACSVGAPTASADLVEQGVVRCEHTATWQITVGSTSYADLTHDPAVCKILNADRTAPFAGPSRSRTRTPSTQPSRQSCRTAA